MSYLGAALVPVFICATVGIAFFKKLDPFSLFIEGAKKGFSVVFEIAPSMLALLVAVGMLSASGVLEAFATLISPVTTSFGFPPQVLPLVMLRPVSGGGAIAILENILASAGADSVAGRLASVICGGSETTFYAIAVYFGAADIKKTSYAVPAALIADFTVIITATLLLNLGF